VGNANGQDGDFDGAGLGHAGVGGVAGFSDTIPQRAAALNLNVFVPARQAAASRVLGACEKSGDTRRQSAGQRELAGVVGETRSLRSRRG
jgi:hypothetical protein